jgi:ribosome-associated protein
MDQTMQEKIPAITVDSTSEEMAHAIFDVLDAKKAYKLKVLRVNDQTVITDYFVIATGNSNTHVKSLGGEVEYKLSLCGIDPLHYEGRDSDGWVVIDYGHVMVHIFSRDQRDFYQLEKLYGDAEEIHFVGIDEAAEAASDKEE